MGHREDLLAGAKRCLYERGYARTTARDIVAASNTNLASIGYHFGSKEALLNAAMMEAIEEVSAEIGEALAAEMDNAATPLERFTKTWTRIIESFTTHQPLWVATFEALTQANRSPEVKSLLADALQQGREGLVSLFGGHDGPPDERKARTVGSMFQALLTGVWVQWVVDAERAPSAEDLGEALRLIAESIKSSSTG